MKYKNIVVYKLVKFIFILSLCLYGCDSPPTSRKSQEVNNQTPLGNFEVIPKELIEEILSYLGTHDLQTVQQLNKTFLEALTGAVNLNQRGIKKKLEPTLNPINPEKWIINKKMNFWYNSKLKDLTPEEMPNFFFYWMLGQVQNLPESFWKFLKGTNIYYIDLTLNQIGDRGLIKLGEALENTKVHTLNLSMNEITNNGLIEFTNHLKNTEIQTINLSYNRIKDIGAVSFAKILKHTNNSKVRKINLHSNKIKGKGALELAEILNGTQVEEVDLSDNPIEEEVQSILTNTYPLIKWGFTK